MEIISVLEQQVTESDASNFDANDQAERNYRYFTLQPIGNEQRGRSHYISPDVLDQVQSQLSLFKETFLSNRQVSKFVCNGSCPQMEADAKTAYVNNVFERNEKERLFSDFWQDAFLAKRGVILAEWMQDTTKVDMPVQGMNEQQIMQMASQLGSVVDLDTSQLNMQQVMGPMGPMVLFEGNVSVEIDDSYVNLTLCKPENYFRDPQSSSVGAGMWASYRDDVPRGTLIRQGYDPDQVKYIKHDYAFSNSQVDTGRKAHDQSQSAGRQYSRSKDQECVTVYKTWTWLNMVDIGAEFGEFPDEMRLYEIHWGGGEVLKWADGTYAIREADQMPFFEWTEIPISHSANGMCSADVVAHTQKTQSTLKRLIIDNQQMRNSSRYEAVRDNLKNPRDLLDNSIGSVIWSSQIGSVAALATPELSPLTLSIVGMLQQDNERRSGLSSLSTGMNTDAIRYQNADSMIERLSDAGKSRPMAAARDWAYTCLIPLCRYIVKLGMDYDQTQTQVEQCGRIIPVVPSQWQDEKLLMDVAVALTPQEAKDHGQKLLVMHQLLSQDEQLKDLYGVKQRHAMFDAVFESMGVTDSTVFMLSPDSPEFGQMMQVKQQAAQQAQAQAQEDIMFQRQLLDNEQARKWAADNSNIMDTMADNRREDDKFDWTKKVDTAEIAIERQQKRNAYIG